MGKSNWPLENDSSDAGKGKATAYNAKGSHELKEVDEKKKGGRVKRARGGKIDGGKEKERLDRPHRASGGRVGSDTSPLSSAAKVTSPVGHTTDD